jgi:dTDP-4-dehydrorhamnose reductase
VATPQGGRRLRSAGRGPLKILVTGAGGQLGLDLLDAFADHDTVGLTRAQLDVTVEAAVADALATLRPALVINAAAGTDVDGCEADPDGAHRANALGPWWLARGCERVGATFVTFSTDYVFDGSVPVGPSGQPRGYTEDDPVAPLSAYGRSKAAGERLVRETLREHHIVRTAWVSGARGRNFVRTMLRLADVGDPVRVVDDQTGSPTTTRDLAAAVRDLAVSGRYGTVHLVNEGTATWFDVAAAVFARIGRDVDLAPQPSSAISRPAPRPAWSVLDTTHARTMGVGPLPYWEDALDRLLAELEVHAEPRGAGPK